MKNRLQFRHDSNLYANLDEIKAILSDSKQYSLYAEPIIFKYGDDDNTNLVLVIGNNGTSTDKSKKDYTIIDINNLSSGGGGIQTLSYYTEDKANKAAKISTDTVTLSGKTIYVNDKEISNIGTSLDKINTNTQDISNIKSDIDELYSETSGNTELIAGLVESKQDTLEYLTETENGYDFDFSGNTAMTLTYKGDEVVTLKQIENIESNLTRDIVYTGDSETKESDYITFATSGSNVTDAMQSQTDNLIKIILDNEYTTSTSINNLNDKIDNILERITILEGKVNTSE